MMAYTAFKAGDKVSWDGIKAMVVEDTDEYNDEVKVYVSGHLENWFKVARGSEGADCPVILES